MLVNTREAHVPKKEPGFDKRNNDTSDHEYDHARFPYLPEHPAHDTHVRIIRTQGHNTLPNFIGTKFPKSDDANEHNLYCASMLMLLKPWRDLETDLKASTETWTDAFSRFKGQASQMTLNVLAGIQYYHESERDAFQGMDNSTYDSLREGLEGDDDEIIDESRDEAEDRAMALMTEERLKLLKTKRVDVREANNGIEAVHLGKTAKVLLDADEWGITDDARARQSNPEDVQALLDWTRAMDMQKNNMNELGAEVPDVEKNAMQEDPRTEMWDEAEGTAEGGVGHVDPDAGGEAAQGIAETLSGMSVEQLNEEQRKAYDIVLWHVDQTRAGVEGLPPLRMMIQGEGGTGKSRVIQTITDAFERLGMRTQLVKGAYTGIAASVIDGKTLHAICQLLVGKRKGEMTEKRKKKLQEFWKSKSYLIIDEISMVSKTLFATLSKMVEIGKAGTDEMATRSFGGLNVILVGDFHQFPPVAGGANDALYKKVKPAKDTAEMILGRRLFEEFTTVVILRQQMRVVDEEWRKFLSQLRFGDVSSESLTMLRELIIGRETRNDDFGGAAAGDCALVTPRHAVRNSWNGAAIRDFCSRTGRMLYICPAEDVVGKTGNPPNLYERWAMEVRLQTTGRRNRTDLPEEIELAIGAKVMVTQNIDTDLDIANGSRGEIVEIVLHPDEGNVVGHNGVARLSKPPLYVLVKLQRTKLRGLAGLEQSVVPVEPRTSSMQINAYDPETRTTRKKTVVRRQYAMTLAYAFTDYRSQGQTIPNVIVDLKRPPTGENTSRCEL